MAVVDATGKVVDTCAIFPHQPQRQWDSAKATLAALVARHRVQLIAVGNGTASRETERSPPNSSPTSGPPAPMPQ